MRLLTQARGRGTMAQPTEIETARDLGHLERLLTVSYSMGLYNGTCVACQYSIPSYLQGPEQHFNLVDLFQYAVGSTVMRHPLCQVSLLNPDEKTPSWGRIPTLNLKKLIEWRTLHPQENYEQVRKQTLSKQLDTKFASVETEPGWRIVVLRRQPDSDSFEVFFVFNHANFDGISGKIFQQDLLQRLDTLSRQFRESGRLSFARRAPFAKTRRDHLPPPIESMAVFPISPLWMTSVLWKKFCPSLLRRSQAPEWATVWPRIDRTLPYETGLRTLVIPWSVLETVLIVCRHKGNTTITALLHVLTVISLARQIPESEMPAMKSVTTIDLRRHMPNPLPAPAHHKEMDPAKTMANIVGRLTHKFDKALLSEIRGYTSLLSPPDGDASSFISSSTSSPQPKKGSAPSPPPPKRRKRGGEPLCQELKDLIWRKAAEVRGEIKDKLEMGLKNDELGMMKFADDWRGFVRATLHRPRSSTFLVSNLMAIDGEPQLPPPPPPVKPRPSPHYRHDRHGRRCLQDSCYRNTSNGEGSSRLQEVHDEEEEEEDHHQYHEQFSIRRASFALAAHVNGAGIHLGVMSVSGGDMTIELTWHKGVIDDGVMKTLGEDLTGWLRNISKGKDIDRSLPVDLEEQAPCK